MKHLFVSLTLIAAPVTLSAQSAQEDEGKGFLTNLIEDNLSSESTTVNIQGFKGALSSAASITSLTVSDADGVWLTLEDVILDWNRSALFAGRIDVEELSASRIIVARAPQSEQSGPAAQATPFALPELPVSIVLGALQIDRIELGDSFLGEELAFSLTGSASLADGEGAANIAATRLDSVQGLFKVDGSYSNVSNVLGLNLNVNEGEDGIAARLLDIPERPSIALTVAGEALLTEYAADITLATNGTDRITGRFGLTQVDGQPGFDLDIGGDVTPLLVPEYQSFFGSDVSLQASGQQLSDGRLQLSQLDLASDRLNLKGSVLVGSEGWPERIDLTGAVIDTNGAPVLLPLSGPKTYVDEVGLTIAYDQAVSDEWVADFVIAQFSRPGLEIATLTLEGGGTLRPGEGVSVGAFNADLAYEAQGLKLDDSGAAQALGDRLGGVIQMQRTEDAPLEITAITLNGPGITLRADAVIDTPTGSPNVKANIDLKATDISRFSTLAGQDLAGSADVVIQSDLTPLDGLYAAQITGTTQDLAIGIAQADPLMAGRGNIDLQFVRDAAGTRIERLSVTTDEADIQATATLTNDTVAADFDVNLRDVTLVEPTLNGPASVTGSVDTDAAGVMAFDVTGSGPDVTFTAKGTSETRDIGQNIFAAVTAEVADLATYAALSGQDVSGAASAELSGVLLTDGLRFDGTLSAATADMQTGIADLDPLLLGVGTLSTSLSRPRETAYRISDLQLNMTGISLTADADIDTEGQIAADFDLTLPDVAKVLPDLRGPARANGRVTRAYNGIAQVNVTAALDGADVEANIAITPQDNQITGEITAQVADLAPYRDLVGQPLAGGVAVKINGQLLPDLSKFDLDLDVQTSDLETGVAQADPLLRGASTLTLSAKRDDNGIAVPAFALNNPQLNATGELTTAGQSGTGSFDIVLNQIGLIAPGLNGPAIAKGTAELSSDGLWNIDTDVTAPGADIALNATYDTESLTVNGTTQARIANLAAYRNVIGQPVSGGLNADVTASFATDLSDYSADLNISTQDIGIGNESVDILLRGTGRLTGQVSGGGNGLRVRDLSLQTNNLSVTGNLDRGAGGSGTGSFDARLRDVGLFTDQLSGPVTATGTASVGANGSYGINATGTGPGGISVRADGSIAPGGRLAIDVGGTVPLGIANAALAPRRLSGTADFDLAINGPPALESVNGRVTLNNARLAAPTLGQALNNIAGGVALANGTARVNITGDVQTGGSIAITGPVGLTGGLAADLVVALQSVKLRDPELYETSVAGTITVKGPLTGGARISGALSLGPTDIQVPSSGIGALGDLPDVVHVGADGRVVQTLNRAGALQNGTQSGPAASNGPIFPLDITVDAPNRIFIRGRGLDAELGGGLSLSGTTANIVPVGQFSLIRGRLDILQQRFELTEGTASLQGDFDPFIRLVATTEARTGTVIRIIVEGPAGAPEVRFESTPQLPQDEVLAQLIFGRDLTEISPLQAVQLAAAVGTLAGRGGGGLIDGFREGIGLDELDVTTDADGNAALRAGAYLSSNVYTDVTINALGETEINLNLDITDEITAKGTVDADGETSIGIFFERDY